MYKFIFPLLLLLTFAYNTETLAFEIYLEHQYFDDAEIIFPGDMVAKFFVRGEQGERVFLEHRVVRETLIIPFGIGVLLQGAGGEEEANRVRMRYRNLLRPVEAEYQPLPQRGNPECLNITPSNFPLVISARNAGIVRMQGAILMQASNPNELYVLLLREIENRRHSGILRPELHPDYLFYLGLFERAGLLPILAPPQNQALGTHEPASLAAPVRIDSSPAIITLPPINSAPTIPTPPNHDQPPAAVAQETIIPPPHSLAPSEGQSNNATDTSPRRVYTSVGHLRMPPPTTEPHQNIIAPADLLTPPRGGFVGFLRAFVEAADLSKSV